MSSPRTQQISSILEGEIENGKVLCSFIGGPLDRTQATIPIASVTMKAYVHEGEHYNIRRWVWEHTERIVTKDDWGEEKTELKRTLTPTTIAVHTSIASPFETLLNSYLNQ